MSRVSLSAVHRSFSHLETVDSFDGKEGKMNGVTFRYFSYSVHSYRRILGDHGFTLVDVHVDSGNNTYYLAKKAEPPS